MGWEDDQLPASLAKPTHVLSEKWPVEAGSAGCFILTSLASPMVLFHDLCV